MSKLLLSIAFVFISIYSNCQSKIFFDDFLDNRNHWDVGEEASEISLIQNGKYRIKIIDENGWHWFGNKFQFNSDSKYKLETLITQTRKPSDNSLIGLIFNAKEDIKSHFILLLDTEVGSFKLIKVNDKNVDVIQEWTKTPAVKLKNKIEIEKNGDNYIFFINDVYVTRKKIIEYFGNTYGYYAGPLTECEVEYIKIQGGNFTPNNTGDISKDIQFNSKKGWTTLFIKNQLFSATFIDDFTSPESSDNWDLYNGEGASSSSIQSERLKIKFTDKGRVRVPITEAPMDLSKNNFDIIAIFDKRSTSIYQGVIFGHQDGRNYSSITFSPDYKMMVYERNEDGILTGDDEKKDIYALPNYDNELRIKKENGVITVYFNGVKAYELPDLKLSGNGIGIIAGGDANMNEALTKYVSVNIILPDEIASINGLDKKVNIIKLKKSNGVYSVPVELNGVLKIDFIFDSGASDVSISPDVALTLIKTGTIKKEDWLEGAYYKFADGSTAKSKRFKMSSIKIGNKIIKNVTCSISNSIDAPMLLGQSVLSKFGKYTFDNVTQRLILD